MERSEIDTQLVLVSARESRVGDHWDKDAYDVRLGDASGPVVGRIMRATLMLQFCPQAGVAR